MSAPKRSLLGVFDLTLFNFAAIASIRWLASAAHAGPGTLTLWLLAALLFFIPSATAVSRLSETYPESEGFFEWVEWSCGPWHGFVCLFFYWVNILLYLPSLLMTGMSIVLAMAGGQWAARAEAKTLLVGATLVLLIVLTLVKMLPPVLSKWAENLGSISSYLIWLLLVVGAAIAFVREGSQTVLALAPSFDFAMLNYWSQLVFAFGGIELASVMTSQVDNPARTVPRATWLSGGATAGFYIAGTAAMLVLMRPESISILSGLGRGASLAAAQVGLAWVVGTLAMIVLAGVMGQASAWLVAGGRLLTALVIRTRYPRGLTLNRALLIQSAGCIVFLILSQAGDAVAAGYQTLVDMTVITYFIPYLYLFWAAWRQGARLAAMTGGAITTLGLGLSFLPTADVTNLWLFETKLIGGTLALLALGWYVFRKR